MAATPGDLDKAQLTRSLKSMLAPLQKKQDRQMMGCLWGLLLLVGLFVLFWKPLELSWWFSALSAVGASVIFTIAYMVVMSEDRETEVVLDRFNRRYRPGTAERQAALQILRRLGEPNKSYFMQAAQTLAQALDNQAELHGESPETALKEGLAALSSPEQKPEPLHADSPTPPQQQQQGRTPAKRPTTLPLEPTPPPETPAPAPSTEHRFIPLEPDRERRDD